MSKKIIEDIRKKEGTEKWGFQYREENRLNIISLKYLINGYYGGY